MCACGCCRTWSTGRALRRDCCFRRLCRRTTDSLVFSYGASCKCDCRNSRLAFWTESLARLSEAFCCRAWPDRSVVPRGLEERSGTAREPPGTGDGAPIAMGDCEAIPVAAGNVFGDWSAGDRVWETADCGLLA